MEFGLFSDEGCVEGGFYSVEEAIEALAKYDNEDELHVAEICPEHPDEEREYCEECYGEVEEEDEEDES